MRIISPVLTVCRLALVVMNLVLSGAEIACPHQCTCNSNASLVVIECNGQNLTSVPYLPGLEYPTSEPKVDLYFNRNRFPYLLRHSFFSITGRLRLLEITENEEPIEIAASAFEPFAASLTILRLDPLPEDLNSKLVIFSPLLVLEELTISSRSKHQEGHILFNPLFSPNSSPRLEVLQLHNCGLRDIADVTLRQVKLKTLSLSHNKFTEIPPIVTSLIASSLIQLCMANNYISRLKYSHIPDGCKLKILDLSFNDITIIDEQALGKCKHMQIVNLSHNKKLANIDVGVFHGLVNLILDFDHTSISSLDFIQPEQIVALKLEGSRIPCTCELQLTHRSSFGHRLRGTCIHVADVLAGRKDHEISYLDLNCQGHKGKQVTALENKNCDTEGQNCVIGEDLAVAGLYTSESQPVTLDSSLLPSLTETISSNIPVSPEMIDTFARLSDSHFSPAPFLASTAAGADPKSDALLPTRTTSLCSKIPAEHSTIERTSDSATKEPTPNRKARTTCSFLAVPPQKLETAPESSFSPLLKLLDITRLSQHSPKLIQLDKDKVSPPAQVPAQVLPQSQPKPELRSQSAAEPAEISELHSKPTEEAATLSPGISQSRSSNIRLNQLQDPHTLSQSPRAGRATSDLLSGDTTPDYFPDGKVSDFVPDGKGSDLLDDTASDIAPGGTSSDDLPDGKVSHFVPKGRTNDLFQGRETSVLVPHSGTPDMVQDCKTSDVVQDCKTSGLVPDSISSDLVRGGVTSDGVTSNLVPDSVTSDLVPDDTTSALVSDGVTSDLVPDGVTSALVSDSVTSNLVPDGVKSNLVPDDITSDLDHDNTVSEIVQAETLEPSTAILSTSSLENFESSLEVKPPPIDAPPLLSKYVASHGSTPLPDKKHRHAAQHLSQSRTLKETPYSRRKAQPSSVLGFKSTEENSRTPIQAVRLYFLSCPICVVACFIHGCLIFAAFLAPKRDRT